MSAAASLLVALCVVMGLASCTPNKPPPPPATRAQATEIRASHFFGTPLSGPKPATQPEPTDMPPTVQVTFVGLQQFPRDALSSLASQARLIAITRGGVPTVASGRLTRMARFAIVDDAAAYLDLLDKGFFGRATHIKTLSGIVPANTTVSFVAEDTSRGDPAGSRRSLEIDVCRSSTQPAAALQVAVVLQDRVTTPTSQLVDAAPPVLVRELALVDVPAGLQQFAAIVPLNVGGEGDTATAAIVRIDPTKPPTTQAVADCMANLKRSAAEASTRPFLAMADNPDWPAYANAIDSLSHHRNIRAALVFLASQTDARICEDTALSADTAAQNAIADRVVKKMTGSTITDKASIGWAMDQTTMQYLLELLTADKVPPELAAVLSMHAGEVGRHESSLQSVLHGVSGPQDLETRLTAENMIFLEDSSPASRVRAYDWLVSRDRAPVDFDPLGDPHERRAALEKAEAPPPPETQSAGGTP